MVRKTTYVPQNTVNADNFEGSVVRMAPDRLVFNTVGAVRGKPIAPSSFRNVEF